MRKFLGFFVSSGSPRKGKFFSAKKYGSGRKAEIEAEDFIHFLLVNGRLKKRNFDKKLYMFQVFEVKGVEKTMIHRKIPVSDDEPDFKITIMKRKDAIVGVGTDRKFIDEYSVDFVRWANFSKSNELDENGINKMKEIYHKFKDSYLANVEMASTLNINENHI